MLSQARAMTEHKNLEAGKPLIFETPFPDFALKMQMCDKSPSESATHGEENTDRFMKGRMRMREKFAWGMQPWPRTIWRPRNSTFDNCWTMVAAPLQKQIAGNRLREIRPSKRRSSLRHQRHDARGVPPLVAKPVTGQAREHQPIL